MATASDPTDPLVLFMPSGKRGRFPVGTNLLEAARLLGVNIESVCGGRATCGRCQIEVQEGGFAKHGIVSSCDHISPKGGREARYESIRSLPVGRRLSCSATIQGDLVVAVPQDAVVNAQVVRKAPSDRLIERNPAVRLCYVEVDKPDMHKPLGDLDRLKAMLTRDWGIHDPAVPLRLLPQLQKILRKKNWGVTVAIHHDDNGARPEILAIWPGLHNKAYGIACDIGSTTIALHLLSLLSGRVVASSGVSNPQIRLGEDLMSRVSYVMMNPGGCEAMALAVREAVNGLIGQVCTESGVDAGDILDAVFVANPIMHHLFLGIDPTELGQAPFALAVSGAIHASAAELGLQANEGAHVYLLPCIAGHVGADAAAATLAEGPHRQDRMMLLIDIGTNAEIVLGNGQRVITASSPTGPAFEGAEISSGQRAAPGAIERVRIDRETLEPRFRIIGSELWSDQPGFPEDAVRLGVTGTCGSAIVEVVAELYLCGIVSEDGAIDGALAARSPRIVANGRTFSYLLHDGCPQITVTQNDVRAVQLAKAALYAGIRLLMEKQGVAAVDMIRLAGAFGSFIDPKYAMVLGLIPDCDLSEVRAVGNAAGTGAMMALLNRDCRREIEQTVQRIEKIETALEPHFQQLFVDAMTLPHKVDSFPNLVKEVRLPPHNEANDGCADSMHRRPGRKKRPTPRWRR